MSRTRLTATLQNRILREFNYLCAICGRPRPHIHHIDGNPSNNDDENLLPLCPNHHLLDAHDPTERIAPAQLLLFRKHRDPYILLAQFKPLLIRLAFLDEPLVSQLEFLEIEARARDLVAFLESLKQGQYYSQRVAQLIGWKELHWPSNISASATGRAAEMALELVEAHKRDEKARTQYRDALRTSRERVVELVVESLRYQEWRSIPQYGDA